MSRSQVCGSDVRRQISCTPCGFWVRRTELVPYAPCMTPESGERSKHYPAIEKKHGQSVQHWLDLLAASGEEKYEQQMALLQDEHGFSRAHANAVVMTHRGSSTTRRFENPESYFKTIDPIASKTARDVFAVMQNHAKDLDLVMAWNQPMLKLDKDYVFGLSVAKNHITMGPIGDGVMAEFSDRLVDYKCGKKTFIVPFDWAIDTQLLCDLVDYRLAELK